MLPALSSYLIREHVGMLKLTDTYDIMDGATGAQLAVAKEKKRGEVVAYLTSREASVPP